MSDDKEFSVLPTRDDHPAGKSNENRMLAKTGRLGNDSFIKDQRNIVGPEGQKGVVKLKTRGGMPEFTTEFEEPEDEPLEYCPLVDNGLVDCYYNASYNYSAAYSDELPIEKLISETGEKVTAKNLKNGPTYLHDLREPMPSMFSGLMRRVMQMERGKKIDKRCFEFSPSFGVTHGLWCTANGTRWLLEIDNTDNSVYVRSIKFCKKLPKDWQGAESEWEASLSRKKFLKKIAPYWTPTKVGTERVKIGTFGTLAGGPHYPTFGWAFSYTGDRACIVTVELRRYGWHDELWSTLYEITITADGNGKPSTASCAALESDWFINRDTKEGVLSDYGSLQVPYGLSGVCRTYGFWGPTSPERSLDAPVFAYYLKDGGMHVLRFYSPRRPPEFSDVGSTIESIPVNKRRHGYHVDMGAAQVPVDYNPAITFPEPWFDGYYVNALGVRNLSDRKFLEVGSFYSAYVPKAAGSETLSTLRQEIYEAGGVTWGQDDVANIGYSTERQHFWTDVDGRSWYLMFIYTPIYQPVRVAQTDEKSTQVDWSRMHFPFAVLHGHDRESYTAGYHEIERKTTRVTTTENCGTFRTAPGDVCQTLGPVGNYQGSPISIIGAWNVTEVTYPTYGPPVGGIAGPTTTTEELEEKTKLVSKLVIGDQVFDVPSSGFGYYGPDALNFLYFRAAASAFGENEVPKTMRSPDYQNLHLQTNCGSYTTTDVSNSFVGVI